MTNKNIMSDVIHAVFIPALMRDLTGGVDQVQIPGENVRAVVEELERRYPGIEDRLCEDGQLKGHIAVAVSGEVSYRGLRQKLPDPSEIHFIPAISGG